MADFAGAALSPSRSEALALCGRRAQTPEGARSLLAGDLFYLLFAGLGRTDLDNDWLYERCREVQAAPDGRLDLWAREHYKSTIITLALTIQDILNNPEITVGIFSHSRPIAKSFLRQIKREFESNSALRDLFPHVMPPKSGEKRTWSENEGLVVRRGVNKKEATVEAWGLVDGQPIGRHFDLLVYDDVVTPESVASPEMIKKTTDAWRISLNLGARGGKIRMIGTRYHAADTYAEIMEQGSVVPRIHPATADGTPEGEPVFLPRGVLTDKRRDMGPYIFACQMLQNPLADKAQGFAAEWFKKTGTDAGGLLPGADVGGHGGRIPPYGTDAGGASPPYGNERPNPAGMNAYILVDPAGANKKYSDYTAMWVVGLNADGSYYVLDGIHDRLNLTGRCRALFDLHRKWRPAGVGYEKYGMQADVEHMRFRMEQENYRFGIAELGGKMPKTDRIRRLVPVFEQGRMWFPLRLMKIRIDGTACDLTDEFYRREYLTFPVSSHDDMLDCLSRILDPELGATFPGTPTRVMELPRKTRCISNKYD